MRTSVNFAIKTTKGRREINQDSLFCTYNHDSDFMAIVCDGVGSIKNSEIASKIITSTFATEFEKTYKLDKPIIWARETLALATKRIDYTIRYRNLPDISSTLALLLIIKNKYYVLNVGDTRIYGISKDKQVKQLTVDHNYYNFLLKKKASEKVLKQNMSKWHALTKFVDRTNPANAEMSYTQGPTTEFRYFLICTDGLYGYCDNQTISKRVYWQFLPLVLRSYSLNRHAYKKGSTDNISNILVSCKTYGK